MKVEVLKIEKGLRRERKTKILYKPSLVYNAVWFSCLSLVISWRRRLIWLARSLLRFPISSNISSLYTIMVLAITNNIIHPKGDIFKVTLFFITYLGK